MLVNKNNNSDLGSVSMRPFNLVRSVCKNLKARNESSFSNLPNDILIRFKFLTLLVILYSSLLQPLHALEFCGGSYGSCSAAQDACDTVTGHSNCDSPPTNSSNNHCQSGTHYHSGNVFKSGGFDNYHFTCLSGGGCGTGITEYTINSLCLPEGFKVGNTKGAPQMCVGNPLNPATGNKFQAEQDISIPNSDLSFSRYYNSVDEGHAGELIIKGRWTYDYLQRLDPSNGFVTVYRPDGKELVFDCPATTGSCTGDTDLKIELEKTSTGYSLLTSSNNTEDYDTNGKLQSITSLAGQTQTLSYNSTSGLLETVTDHFNRTLTFTFGTSSRIETITDPNGEVYTYDIDTDKNLLSVTYPDDTPGTTTDNPKREFQYNDTNFDSLLTGIVDENGNLYAEFDYDTQGRAIQSKHAGGVEQVDLVYNVDGTTTVTDSLGATNTFTFDIVAFVPKTTAISGGQCGSGCSSQAQAQTYDTNGYIASSTDFEGNVTNFVNNSRGLQTSRTEAVGELEERTITTDWHSTLRLPTKITDNGKETSITYNTNGQVLTRTEKDLSNNNTRTTTFTYDSNGNVLTINGPRTDIDDITTFTYDTSGNRASMSVDPDGAGSAPAQVTNYTSYDNSGRLLSMTDPNGVVTTMDYDPRGRLESRTVASGTSEAATTTFEYDGVGNVTKITLPNNSYLSYTYDTAQRLTNIEDNLGNKITYTLDDLGNRTKEDVFDTSSTLRRTQSRVFDQLSRMTQHTGGASQVSIFGYDGNGNQVSVLDPLSRSSTSSFDALNRLITSTDPALSDTDYTYDDRDNLISVSDARSLTTTYTYDDLDNLTQLVSPDTGTTTYTYDDAGNRLTQTDARSKTTTYTYDALNRVSSITYPDTSLNVTFTYDSGTNGKGRLTGMTDASGTTTYTYDKRGNLASESKVISGQTYLTSYAYDDADNVTQLTYPSGRTVDYEYNSIGQVVQVETTLGSNTNIVAFDINYHPFGPIKSLIFGNGLSTAYTFDQDYRLTDAVTDNNTHSLTYAYDLGDNISTITDNNDSTRNQSFTYDNLDRLLSGNGIYGSLSYTYDVVGNRLTETKNSVTDTYSYATTSNQVQTITGGQINSFTYDAAGNITVGSGDTFTVNDANRMATAASGSTTATYTYNGKGERTIKVVGSTTTIYHYDQNGQLIAESDALANSQAEYIYLNGQRLALIDPNGTGTGASGIVIDNSDSSSTSTIGNWTTTVTGTGDYEGSDVAQSALNSIEIIIDDVDSSTSSVGNWWLSTASHWYGGTAQHIRWPGSGSQIFTWNFSSISSGNYEVAAQWWAHPQYTSIAPYTINHTQGSTLVLGDQTQNPGWNVLGTFSLDSTSSIELSDDANNKYVMADAIRLIDNTIPTFTWDAPVGTFDVYAEWTQDSSHATDSTYTLHHSTGQTTVTVNQQTNGIGLNYLGTATFDATGKVVLASGSDGNVIADAIHFIGTSTSTTALYYIHSNHLDTPQAITDGSKTVVWSADYEPFGETNITVNTLTNNLRFPGQYADSESGLHYNYFRDYNPSIGRYMQSDPIGLLGGFNTYVYVKANPQKFTDNLGLYDSDFDAAEQTINRLFKGYNIPPISTCSGGVDCTRRGLDTFDEGGYLPETDEIIINELDFGTGDNMRDIALNDVQAYNLLNTYIHEILHANQNLFGDFAMRNLQNGRGSPGAFLHDTIYRWADILTKRNFQSFNELREQCEIK